MALKTYSRKRKEFATPSSSSPSTPLCSSSPSRLNICASSPPSSPQCPPTPTVPKKRRKLSQKPPKYKQMHLSFGQTTRQQCPECGMSYVMIDNQDVELHKRFHSRAFDGRQWLADYGKKVYEVPNSKDYIVRVDATSKPSEKRAVEDMMILVNTELSAPVENDAWKTTPNKGAAFVYVSNKKAIGIVVVERATKGAWMGVESGELIAGQGNVPISMGISRIYTTRNNRRNGIAVLLLEIAREHFIYGLKIEKSQIAWSQPSESGMKVANRWCGVDYDGANRKVLTYIE